MGNVSGSTDFQISASTVAKEALDLCMATDVEEAAQGFEITDAIRKLNLILKNMNVDLHLWKRQRIVVFTIVGRRKYRLGPGGDHACYEDDFIPTTTTAAASSSDTTIDVTELTNNIGHAMSGASNIITNGGPTFTTTANWSATNSTLSISSGKFRVTNSGAAAGYADQTITTVVGRSYLVAISFELGTSAGATFSIIDSNPTTLDTDTLTATGTTELSFTATSTTTTFRFANTSTTTAEYSDLVSVIVYDLTTGDKVGIELDDGTRQWTNIITISTLTLRLVDPLTDDVASGNSIYTYTTLIDRPNRVLERPRYRLTQTSMEAEPMAYLLSRQEYDALGVKDTQGPVTNVYFDPQINEDSSGNRRSEMSVWPTSDNVKQVVMMTGLEALDDIDNSDDLLDIPSEWLEPVIYCLACRLAPSYGLGLQDRQLLIIERDRLMQAARGKDIDRKSLSFRPSVRRGGY